MATLCRQPGRHAYLQIIYAMTNISIFDKEFVLDFFSVYISKSILNLIKNTYI